MSFDWRPQLHRPWQHSHKPQQDTDIRVQGKTRNNYCHQDNGTELLLKPAKPSCKHFKHTQPSKFRQHKHRLPSWSLHVKVLADDIYTI